MCLIHAVDVRFLLGGQGIDTDAHGGKLDHGDGMVDLLGDLVEIVFELLRVFLDVQRRQAIMRNHTAAHLLQSALRTVLGSHVEQAGQYVSDASVRFDFTHFSALTAQELLDVEGLVNKYIMDAVEVVTREMPIDEAKKLGAMALFGEKYGDVVRVVKAGDCSIELCGGTHVDNTAKLGLFKIRTEASVAAGVRRIEAFTGEGVLKFIDNTLNLVARAASALKLNSPMELANGCEKLSDELKAKDKKIAELESEIAKLKIGAIFENAQDIDGVKVITTQMDGADSDMLKNMCSMVTDKEPCAVVLIASVNGEKLTLCCACGKEAVKKGLKAGNIVKAAAQVTGGNGGGKPDMAMAGGKDITKVSDALSCVADAVKAAL